MGGPAVRTQRPLRAVEVVASSRSTARVRVNTPRTRRGTNSSGPYRTFVAWYPPATRRCGLPSGMVRGRSARRPWTREGLRNETPKPDGLAARWLPNPRAAHGLPPRRRCAIGFLRPMMNPGALRGIYPVRRKNSPGSSSDSEHGHRPPLPPPQDEAPPSLSATPSPAPVDPWCILDLQPAADVGRRPVGALLRPRADKCTHRRDHLRHTTAMIRRP